MGCGSKCSRYALLTLHLLIFGAGATLLVSGLFLLLNHGFLHSEVTALLNRIKEDKMYFGFQLQLITYMTMATGGLIMILNVIGFIATWKKVRCCHILYIILVLVTLALKATIVGLWINTRAGTDEWLEGQLKTQMATYTSPSATDTVSVGFNRMFMDARCCGVTTYTDFSTLNVTWNYMDASTNTETVPASCCKGVTSSNVDSYVSSTCTQGPSEYYVEGCYTTFQDVTMLYSKVAYITASITFLLKVLAIVMVCANMDKNKNRIRNSNQGTGGAKPYIGIDAVLKNRGKR